MSKKDLSMNFLILFEKVIGFWPVSINVIDLKLNNECPDLYVISGLGRMGDSIVEELGRENDAVLLILLCDAITAVIRSAALFSTEIRPALLRPSTVRENFEMRLNRAKKNSDLGWSKDDIFLIERYFSKNT